MSPSNNDSGEATGESQPAAPAEDDVRAKFRAALDKKHGGGNANGNPHAQGGSMAPHTNDKVTRQFRRKSGG